MSEIFTTGAPARVPALKLYPVPKDTPVAPYRQPDNVAAAIGAIATTAWSLTSLLSVLFTLHLVLAVLVAAFQLSDVYAGARSAKRRGAFRWALLLTGMADKLPRWRWVLAGVLVDVAFGVTMTVMLRIVPGLGPAEMLLQIGQVGGVTVCCIWWLGLQEVASSAEHTGRTERRYFLPWLLRAGTALERGAQPVLRALDADGDEPPDGR